MKDSFAIVSWDDILRLRHAIGGDRVALAKLWLQLKRCEDPEICYGLQRTIINDTIEDLKSFNLNRLGKTMSLLDEIISQNDRRKHTEPIKDERRSNGDCKLVAA